MWTEKSPRVLVVTTSLGAGGAEKQLVYIANHLAKDFRVTVQSLTSDDFYAHELSSEVQVVTFQMIRSVATRSGMNSFLQVLRFIRGADSSLIITFGFHAMVMVWLSSLGVRTKLAPIVISERSNEMGSSVRRILRFLAYQRAAVITANAKSTLREIGKFPFAATNVLFLTRNYLPLPVGQAASQSSNETFRWICVASMTEKKNHRLLLQALREIRNTGLTCRVQLVGDGPLRAQIEDAVREFALADVVEFLGLRRDVSLLLTSADAFVLASDFEGTPNAVLEAGLASLPIVATDAGDMREVVSHENWEYITEGGNAMALADAMSKVMRLSRGERRRLGHSNRAHVRAMFSGEENLRVWNEIISNALVTAR